MGNKDDETPISNLDDAFEVLAGRTSIPPEPSIFEQVSTIPPGEHTSEDPQPKETHLTLVETINLESELLGNNNPEIRREAADVLIKIAENEECTIMSARRILDALLFRNKSKEGEFDSHVRKARKCLEDIITLGPIRDTTLPKRTTWPYLDERNAPNGQPMQKPEKSPIDTTAKIRNTNPKK